MSDGGRRAVPIWSTFSQYSVVSAEKFIRLPVGMAISGIAARAFGAEVFGTYTSLLVLLTVLTPLASFGLESLGISLAARADRPSTYFRAVGLQRLVTGLVAAIAFLGISSYIAYGPEIPLVQPGVLGILALVVVLRWYELGENVLFAQAQVNRVVRFRLAAYMVSAGIILFVLLVRPSADAVLALQVVEPAILLFIYVRAFRPDLLDAFRSNQARDFKKHLALQVRMSFPVFASAALVLVLLNIDKLLVFELIGRRDAGFYNAAAKLVDVSFFLPVAIGTVHAAAFTRAGAGAALVESYRSAILRATIIAVGAAMLLAVLAPWVMTLIYGQEYRIAASTLAWLAPCLIPVTWVSLRTRALIAVDAGREVLRLTGIAMLIHVPIVSLAAATGSIQYVAASQTASWFATALVLPLCSRTARALGPLAWRAS